MNFAKSLATKLATPLAATVAFLLMAMTSLSACAHSSNRCLRDNCGRTYDADKFDGKPGDSTLAGQASTKELEGLASYYHDSLAGNQTANGEIYQPTEFTAASRTLPFHTLLRVTNLKNGKTVTIRINDRGPFRDERRILDLSRAAATRIEMIRDGVVPIKAEILRYGKNDVENDANPAKDSATAKADEQPTSGNIKQSSEPRPIKRDAPVRALMLPSGNDA